MLRGLRIASMCTSLSLLMIDLAEIRKATGLRPLFAPSPVNFSKSSTTIVRASTLALSMLKALASNMSRCVENSAEITRYWSSIAVMFGTPTGLLNVVRLGIVKRLDKLIRDWLKSTTKSCFVSSIFVPATVIFLSLPFKVCIRDFRK
ncbi:orff [Streptococcus phage Cp1]|uniref:Orff protein n=1 Tax=Streptococcus phage Cp-1 TaxID=10747 RepID=Q37994_BPCP1|nr:orff [Streptococcus phage Cp1]